MIARQLGVRYIEAEAPSALTGEVCCVDRVYE